VTPRWTPPIRLIPSLSATQVANVTGTTAGTKNNSVQITSTEGGTGNTSNASPDVTPATPVTLQGFDVD